MSDRRPIIGDLSKNDMTHQKPQCLIGHRHASSETDMPLVGLWAGMSISLWSRMLVTNQTFRSPMDLQWGMSKMFVFLEIYRKPIEDPSDILWRLTYLIGDLLQTVMADHRQACLIGDRHASSETDRRYVGMSAWSSIKGLRWGMFRDKSL